MDFALVQRFSQQGWFEWLPSSQRPGLRLDVAGG